MLTLIENVDLILAVFSIGDSGEARVWDCFDAKLAEISLVPVLIRGENPLPKGVGCVKVEHAGLGTYSSGNLQEGDSTHLLRFGQVDGREWGQIDGKQAKRFLGPSVAGERALG